MEIIKITDKNQLNNFVSAQKHSQFLQSWQWGEFHEKVSGKVYRLGVEDSGELIAAATIIKKNLPIGKNYFYCPRGPVIGIRNQESEIMELLFGEIKKLTKEEGTMFLRFDPIFQITNYQLPVAKTISVQPSKTLILDVTRPEEELLKNMHQKTRYNIRLAERKGVEIIKAGKNRFEEFWQLMCQTGERDNFRTHGINYYKEMVKLDENFIKLFLAEYKGKIISAVIVSFFGDTVTYMHGASSNENRDVMAPYLLQWHSIKLAKEFGYKYYDFYGINEKRWPGVTRFKKGFSGREVEYQGTYDLPFDQGWYNIYKMVRKVRRTF